PSRAHPALSRRLPARLAVREGPRAAPGRAGAGRPGGARRSRPHRAAAEAPQRALPGRARARPAGAAHRAAAPVRAAHRAGRGGRARAPARDLMPARARDKVGAVSRSGRSAVTRAPHLERAIACALLAALIAACSHVSTVRVQEEAVEVGPGLRPVAAVQANAIRGSLLFIPIGPAADLDRVVNHLMVAAAKTMGADKVVLLD